MNRFFIADAAISIPDTAGKIDSRGRRIAELGVMAILYDNLVNKVTPGHQPAPSTPPVSIVIRPCCESRPDPGAFRQLLARGVHRSGRPAYVPSS
jgi:hypothetical protein